MGRVIPFPGVDPATIRPRPTCIEDLPNGAKALVVISHDHGFTVVIRPCSTPAEHMIRRSFPSRREAMQFARRAMAGKPTVFQLIIDETGDRVSRTLEDILGPGPDPMGLGGAA